MYTELDPNLNKPWSCLLDCVCEITKLSSDTVIRALGYNGNQIVNKDLPSPYCYRGYHPDTMGLALLKLGWVLAYYNKSYTESNVCAGVISDVKKCEINVADLFDKFPNNIFLATTKHAYVPPRGKVINFAEVHSIGLLLRYKL